FMHYHPLSSTWRASTLRRAKTAKPVLKSHCSGCEPHAMTLACTLVVELHRKLIANAFRQRDASRASVRRRLVHFVLLTHHDLKPALTISHDVKHLFILRG